MSAHCIECRRPFGILELTHETPDGELCADCDASYPPTLRPSLGYVPALHDAEHIGGITKAERDANAHLIEAAPTMLAALEDLADAVMSLQATFGVLRGKTPEHDDIYTHERWAEEFLCERAAAARAAIAKATGSAA